jgi:hypothetical protein
VSEREIASAELLKENKVIVAIAVVREREEFNSTFLHYCKQKRAHDDDDDINCAVTDKLFGSRNS